MGSGGSGGSGAGGSSGGYNSNGWGGTMGSGGNAYSGGGVGGIGTAGTMSGGAGGSAMGGFGNTGAGGSGMAGISTHSGETPAGFTPSAGDPRGTSLGMDAFGNYKGAPGYAGIGSATANRATTMTPKAQMEMFGYVKYPSNPPKVTTAAPKPAQTFSTPIPTSVAPASAYYNRAMNQFGQVISRNSMPGLPPGLDPNNRATSFHTSPKGTIGPQNPNGYTGFGPNSYGNSGLMSGNQVGSGLSVGLGSRMPAAGVSGGVNRTMGNVLGGSGGGMGGSAVGGKNARQ